MLRTLEDLENCSIGATDGEIGHVRDFYFDDEAWIIRYFVVETGSWLSSKKVLMSPTAIDTANWVSRVLLVSITKQQVENCPNIDTDRPVSRQHEMMFHGHYGYPYYWSDGELSGQGSHPNMTLAGLGYGGTSPQYQRIVARDARAVAAADAVRLLHDDHHLRSCKTLMKYHIHATDGDIGHVKGILVDEVTWAVRYMIVDTSHWWIGHRVLIAPRWISGVDWAGSNAKVTLNRDAVKNAPAYHAPTQLDRDEELGIHQHDGRQEIG